MVSCRLGPPHLAREPRELAYVDTDVGHGIDGECLSYYNPQAAASIGFFPGVPLQHTPDLALAGLSDALARGFNGALTQAYGAVGSDVADVYGAFNAGDFGDDDPVSGLPDNVDVLRALSYMCPDDPAVKANIHLNKNGYKVIAKAFIDEMELNGVFK
jgi:hypothetical protein